MKHTALWALKLFRQMEKTSLISLFGIVSDGIVQVCDASLCVSFT